LHIFLVNENGALNVQDFLRAPAGALDIEFAKVVLDIKGVRKKIFVVFVHGTLPENWSITG
jgi:hypothetical protein